MSHAYTSFMIHTRYNSLTLISRLNKNKLIVTHQNLLPKPHLKLFVNKSPKQKNCSASIIVNRSIEIGYVNTNYANGSSGSGSVRGSGHVAQVTPPSHPFSPPAHLGGASERRARHSTLDRRAGKSRAVFRGAPNFRIRTHTILNTRT